MATSMDEADRVIRGVVGLAVIAAGFYFKSWWGATGSIPVATAIFGWCPPCLPIGFSTGLRGAAEKPS